MAHLNFVRGSIKGRRGEFVGSSWKGTDYIKTFTPPSNPKTQGQVAGRTVFQHITHIAALINEEVLKPFTFPKPQQMTPSNRMVHINQELFDDRAWEPAKLKIFDGGLYNPGITAAAIENDGTASLASIDQADRSQLHAYLVFSPPPAGNGNRGKRPGIGNGLHQGSRPRRSVKTAVNGYQ